VGGDETGERAGRALSERRPLKARGTCAECGAPVFKRSGGGRPPKAGRRKDYCSGVCKARARRRRYQDQRLGLAE
jgi:hypothetical protein